MRTTTLATIATLALTSAALAQTPPNPPTPPASHPKRPPTATPATSVITLSEEAYHLDSVGLSVRFPVGCEVSTSRVQGIQTVQIVPRESTWFIKIRTPMTTNQATTIKQAMDETLTLWKGANAITEVKDASNPESQNFYSDSTRAKLIERSDDLALPGGPAGRAYISTPGPKKGDDLIYAYTIFKPAPTQFVTFEFNCHDVDLQKLKGTYEAIVATAVFENAEAVMLARGAAIKSGTAFIASLNEKDYIEAMGTKETWQRLFKPAKDGMKMDDGEIGYRGIKFWRGKRGEINTQKKKSDWSKADQQDGYLSQERTRVLQDKNIIDAVSISFMTPDRSEEAWMIVTSVKDVDGREIGHANETGARNKAGMTILKSETKRPAMTISPPVPPEGYISKFESTILPQLLVNRKAQLETGFYWWGDYIGSDGGSISFHKCNLEQKGALWMLTTSAREATQTQVSTYNQKGEFSRSELANGDYVWEPIALDALKHLWEQKGLPVDR
jgi:hypothetical protein